MSRKRYVGPIPHLSGKSALVEPRVGAAGEVMAQFEEPYLQEARGWWQFPEADFEAAAQSETASVTLGARPAEVLN